MKLLALEQAKFGTLNITEPLAFEPGINLLVADNQSGKSTLVTLIEWLLYGVPPKGTKRNVALLEEWAPWTGERPLAVMTVRPELDGWPEAIRVEVHFDNFAPVVTDAESLENLTGRVNVGGNGTWDLGQQLTGLQREALLASMVTHKGRMEDVLSEETMRRTLISDLAELVEDPQRASLDAALAALNKPSFTCGDLSKSGVQMPKLLRESEERFLMARGQRESLEERMAQLEGILNESEEAGARQAAEESKLERMQHKLAEYELAAAHYRHGEVARLQASLELWNPRFEQSPWLKDFPFKLEGDIERWSGKWASLKQETINQQKKLDRIRAELDDLERYLEKHEKRLPLIEKRSELAELSGALAAAQKDLAAAEEDWREYGEASDPAMRKRFEELDAQFEAHRDYLQALSKWHENNEELTGRRNEIDIRRAELKSLTVIGRPWQAYAGPVIALVGVLAFLAGILMPQLIKPGWLIWLIGAALLVLGVWIGMQGRQISARSDQAAKELEQDIQPAHEELIAEETRHEAGAENLRRHHGIEGGEWARVMELLPEYKSLHFKLESYARATRERDAALRRQNESWDSVRAIYPDAPTQVDDEWLDGLLKTLDSLRDDRERQKNKLADFRHLELELKRREDDRQHRLKQLDGMLEELQLGETAKTDPDRAIQRFNEYMAQAKDYALLLSQFNNAQDKARGSGLDREQYEQRWRALSAEQQGALAGGVLDETGYDKLMLERRRLLDTQKQLRDSADKARLDAGRLRERVAREESVFLELPQARAAEAKAERQMLAVKRWHRALGLLTETLTAQQARLTSNLAPKLTEELQLILKQAPVAGVTEAAIGPQLDLRLRVDGAPIALEGSALIERLSLGARRQLALALRAAVARTLGSSRELPLMLDEPLAELDDERASAWLGYLKLLAGANQVLLTSCHKAQYDWLVKHSGVKPALLKLA